VTEIESQFEEAVVLHTARLRNFARRWLNNQEDAEDTVQDALLKAHTKLYQFEGRAKMSTWLTTIVVNTVRMRLRSRPKVTLVSAESGLGDGLRLGDFLPDARPLPDRAAEHRELYGIVQGYIAELPPGRKRVLRLFAEEEFTVVEIQGKTGLADGTVKSQIKRAR